MSLLAHGSRTSLPLSFSQRPNTQRVGSLPASHVGPALAQQQDTVWPLVHNYLASYMPILRFAPVPRPGRPPREATQFLSCSMTLATRQALAPPPRRSFRETPVSSPDRLREHMTLSNVIYSDEIYKQRESHKRVPSASLEKLVWFIHRLWKCFWLFIVRCLALANTPPRPIIIVYIPCDKTHLKLLAQCTKKAVPPRRGLRRDALI
ncbi:hypothetical protein A9K55_003591 [Cordyceps militaris]|uniref:Uncharacterized protein n=1 Tax=Cordyceps militaris TaxID=73501 RepID=A0A2H4S9I1_CORMI|nr:hypothetical protein A9K55_003591 [Cordyceps militaris]